MLANPIKLAESDSPRNNLSIPAKRHFFRCIESEIVTVIKLYKQQTL
jgi:hypothetical protein